MNFQSIKYLAAAFAIFLSLNACKSHSEGDGHNHGTETGKAESGGEHEHEGEHVNSSTAELTAEQIKTIGIETGMIEHKQLTASLKANGILKVPNQNQAAVTSLYGGVVKSLVPQVGGTVKKGQVLATIANPQFIQLQEEFLTVQTKIGLAELEFARQKELNTGNAGSLKNLQNTEAELKTLLTRKASLQKQIQMMGINPNELSNENLQSTLVVTSPIGGVVSNVMVKMGSFVDANTPIAEIIDNSQLHLDLYVYERDLPKLRVGLVIHFTLTNNPGKEYDAEIYGISTSFEDASKAIAVHCRVKGNKTGLIDGMSISALVSLGKATVTAVPTDAIVNVEGQDCIFIVTDAHSEEEHHDDAEAKTAVHETDELGHDHATFEKTTAHKREAGSLTFERIPVAKGTSEIGYSEITLLKDIPKDAKVVVKGAFFVSAKMTNQGEGHAH